jgi:hypothetical protein
MISVNRITSTKFQVRSCIFTVYAFHYHKYENNFEIIMLPTLMPSLDLWSCLPSKLESSPCTSAYNLAIFCRCGNCSCFCHKLALSLSAVVSRLTQSDGSCCEVGMIVDSFGCMTRRTGSSDGVRLLFCRSLLTLYKSLSTRELNLTVYVPAQYSEMVPVSSDGCSLDGDCLSSMLDICSVSWGSMGEKRKRNLWEERP